jgi:hypothetical protein
MSEVDTEQLAVPARVAARLLSISERSLFSLTQRGTVPCVKLGRSVRYRPETLRQFLADREREQSGGGVSGEQ